MDAALNALANVFAGLFVLGTMASMGLAFNLDQIIKPLRDVSLVVRTLLANFVLVPLAAFLVVTVLSLDAGYATGIAILALCAGAPSIPKYVGIIKGDQAESVGVMFLLVIGTVVALPLMLPLILQGVEIDAGAIAGSLVMTLLVPLGIGLLIKARYPELAAGWQPKADQIANLGLAGSIVLQLFLQLDGVIGLIGTGAILAVALVVALGYGAGYLLGRASDPGEKPLLGFATGQRNVSAAMVVATANFSDQPDVLILVIVSGLVMNVLLLLLAAEIAKRLPAPAAR